MSLTTRGKMSYFGGPNDHGVAADEGLALFEQSDTAKYQRLFLATQPAGTTGLARRLNPEVHYIAMRWNYDLTTRAYLRDARVMVRNPETEREAFAQPVDWGPNIKTGRIADLSPSLAEYLGLKTDDQCVVTVPYPGDAPLQLSPWHPTNIGDYMHNDGPTMKMKTSAIVADTSLTARLVALVEKNFDECFQGDAQVVWAKVSGGQTSMGIAVGRFEKSLGIIWDVRKRQLDVVKKFGAEHAE
jgi:hypothetical protein